MLRNYLKIAYRNLTRNKGYSFINIGGLSVGMAVAILIGLWMYDELSYDNSFENHDRIVQVMQHITQNDTKVTQSVNPYLLAQEIRTHYGDDFRYVLQSAQTRPLLTYGEKKFKEEGRYFEPQVTEMLSLKMQTGTRAGLKDPRSILLSSSVANAFFGEESPLDKTLKMNDRTDLRVTGVYEDFPVNSSFHDLGFILPWELFLIENEWIKELDDPWRPNFTETYAQLAEQANLEKVSAKIKDVKLNKVDASRKNLKPEVFLHPMSKWHLYSEFENGVNVGGRIEYVWLFGIIGAFVLLLACINFMNLSTARSEKRAKEVGIRKAVGSVRSQLIVQFFSESFLVVALAALLSLLLVLIVLPFFNQLADKAIGIPWTAPVFWLGILGFSLLTGLVAGSYPALYLSSFQPLSVLKGVFRVGRFASVPRKVLVVLQFTISLTLIIGTIIVFRQIQYAKNRPVGYNREGLITIFNNQEIDSHLEAIRNELDNSGAVAAVAQSSAPPTAVWGTSTGFNWRGKDPGLAVDFPNTDVSHDYGKTVGWEFAQGRDFSRNFSTDSTALVINEAAARFMGFGDKAVGETVTNDGISYHIVGVIKDMVVQSPYEPVRASVYHIADDWKAVIVLRLNPQKATHASLAAIKDILTKYSTAVPYDYSFVDEEYAKKFGDEERIGKLATFFAILAIFISCLGLFGLASFVAEQRTKEIGVRKVLGASVGSLWRLLSKDFVLLVLIALLIAAPLAGYFMDGWLQKYTYHTELSWWIFAVAGAGALVITLLTVSFQAVKAALMNPVKSLRSE
jgi:putative ABC transport system permease protein